MPPLALSPIGRRYGYHKDLIDHRDYGVAHVPLMKATATSMSNIAFMGPVLDQGDEGSCTAHAAAADREYLHWKELSVRHQEVAPGGEGMFSPSFLYYKERELDGTLDEGDCGSYGRTSCRALAKFGCALRADMPYVAGDFGRAPNADQLDAAAKWATGGYHRLGTVQDMRDCIASGYNFRIGFTVYPSFEKVRGDGIWMPDPKGEQQLGGHEVLAIGYDDDVIHGGAFLVRNSWGSAWGVEGNFYLRYADAADPAVLMDAWIQHLGKW